LAQACLSLVDVFLVHSSVHVPFGRYQGAGKLGGWRQLMERMVRHAIVALVIGMSLSVVQSCSPKADIYRLVLGSDEEKFIVDGPPQIALFDDEALPRSCKRWAGNLTCCQDLFFHHVGQESDAEANRFEAVRDAYEHMIPDVIEPAFMTTYSRGEESLAGAISAVKVSLEDGRVAESLLGYIDTCEDQLRLHFVATTCELCDPYLPPKLTQDKFLQVGEEVCDRLWEACREAPAVLQRAAALLSQAAEKLQATVDAGAKGREVLRAQRWMLAAARQVSNTAHRISWYDDREDFCGEVGNEGYGYRREAWGNLDRMHPGTAPPPASSVPSTPSAQLSQGAGGTNHCIHGKVYEGSCVCEHCWRGEQCDMPALPGPFKEQPLNPLVAEDSIRGHQSLELIGCSMPKDLDSQLARIKLLLGQSHRSSEAEAGEDFCAVPGGSEGVFKGLSLQVPVEASELRLEWLVRVPFGSEGSYTVCYCFGPHCDSHLGSWWTTGHLKIVRTQAEKRSLMMVSEKEFEKAVAANLPSLPAIQTSSERACDEQWTEEDMASITYMQINGMTVFKCREGFIDLGSPQALRCVHGLWYAEEVGEEKESGEGAEALVKGRDVRRSSHWDGQLPRCRWARNDCNVSHDSLKDGSMTVRDGTIMYTCDEGMTMAISGSLGPLREGEQVRRKQDGRIGEIVDAGRLHGGAYHVRFHLGAHRSARDEGEVLNLNGTELEFLPKDRSFTRFCKGDGTWGPVATPRCLQSQELVAAATANAAASMLETEKNVVLPAQPLGRPITTEEGEASPPLQPGTASSEDQPPMLLELAAETAVDSRSMAGAEGAGRQSSGIAGSGRSHLFGDIHDSDTAPQFRIHKWPVRFTKDSGVNVFEVDRCWTGQVDCEGAAEDGIPADTAASPRHRPTISSDASFVGPMRIAAVGLAGVLLLVGASCACTSEKLCCARCLKRQ